MNVSFDLVLDNVSKVPSDLLLLKYAQAPYGIDWKIASLLIGYGICSAEQIKPLPGDPVFFETPSAVAPSRVMFLGTVALRDLGYEELHAFANQAMQILAARDLKVTHMTTTVHGVGIGLDAGESVQNLVMGFLEGLRRGGLTALSKITFVERDERTYRSMGSALEAIGIRLPSMIDSHRKSSRLNSASLPDRSADSPTNLAKTEFVTPFALPSKEHVFVAMPFSEDFQDVFEFGVYAPVRACGYICEKVDESSFTGDILHRIKDRIQSAKLVIADLTGARPNVYLEVGFAWGREVPVIFLARDGETLHFDLKTHRCIFYKTIGQLRRDLERLIGGL